MNTKKTYYNSKLNAQWYHITKNGMTTIRHDLNFDMVPLEESLNSKITFAVLRDPFDRFVSSYCHFIRNHYQTTYRYRNLSGNNMNIILSNNDNEIGVKTFIDELKMGFFDSHNIPQVYYLDGKYMNPIIKNSQPEHFNYRSIDNITHFINFNNISEELSAVFNKPINLTQKNRSSNKFKNIVEEVSLNFIDEIKSIYLQDYELINKVLRS